MSGKMVIIGSHRYGFKEDGDFYRTLEVLRTINRTYPDLTKLVEVFPKEDTERITENMDSAIFVIDGVSLKEFVNALEEMEGE